MEEENFKLCFHVGEPEFQLPFEECWANSALLYEVTWGLISEWKHSYLCIGISKLRDQDIIIFMSLKYC